MFHCNFAVSSGVSSGDPGCDLLKGKKLEKVCLTFDSFSIITDGTGTKCIKEKKNYEDQQ